MARQPAAHHTKVPEIRKGDTVVLLGGKDVGKRGTVDRVIRRDPSPSTVRSPFRRGSRRGGVEVIIEGLNLGKKHQKPRQRSQGGPGQMPTVDKGGILDIPMPVPIGRVMLVCNHCGRPTRIGHRLLDNGRRVRVCRHCGEPLEVNAS